MKKIIIVFLILVAGFLSCNEDGTPLVQFLNTDNLDAQFYEIRIDADTVLHTRNGAVITINKGAITAGNAKTVKLEVKEAYSMEDIVRAGLQTTSNGKLLSSGGMIYLNVKDNGDAKIVSPISISLPSDNLEEGMQLFKGEKDKDGNINWTDPQPIAPNKTLDSIKLGEAIFRNNCSSCHHPIKESTGPPLMFVSQRLPKEWLKRWIHNSAALIASGDPYANCLYDRYNKTSMIAFPGLTDVDLDNLYKYLEQENKRYNSADFPNYKAAFDSCQTYNAAKRILEGKRGKLIVDNGSEVKEKRSMPNLSSVNLSIDSFDTAVFEFPQNIVLPKSSLSTYYQFDVISFGWYNIDIFTKGLPGFETRTLKVKISGEHNEFTNVYLIIPESKVLIAGGLLKGENDTYGFYTDDGTITLPQGKSAFVMAFTEKDDKITFGIAPFKTGLKNEIVVTPQVVTKDVMNQKIKELNFKDFDILAKESKNADSIRKVDIDLKNIESFKPKGADCNCGLPQSDTASEYSDLGSERK